MTAKLEMRNGVVVLRSTVGGPFNSLKRAFDLALYSKEPLEKALLATRPKVGAEAAASTS